MKILYIGKHGNTAGSSDDEGAIAHALEQLGHTVDCVREIETSGVDYDFALFNKYNHVSLLSLLYCPKVFWFFDLVDFPDPQLAQSNATRKRWMHNIVPIADLGFCTDGDWVRKATRELGAPNKLIQLSQGADGRVVGFGKPVARDIPILLYTGPYPGGEKRDSFVAEMKSKYGDKFVHTGGVYRRNLADLIARAQIVVAPDGPITHRYWSNRVYVTLGYGGCLLHPYCAELDKDYEDGKEIAYYGDRDQLHALIERYLANPAKQQTIRENAFLRTVSEHTYLHRVEKLVRTVKERLCPQSVSVL